MSLVCVSYAWSDEHSELPDDNGTVAKICRRFGLSGIHLLRDTTDIMPRGQLSKFMQLIGDADMIVVVLSDSYLRSLNCMYELLQIWNCCNHHPDRFMEKIRIWPSPETKPFSMRDWLAYANHWKKHRDEIAVVINVNGIDLLRPSAQNRWKSISNIAQNVSEILCLTSNTRLESNLEKFCQATIKEFASRSKSENDQTRDTPKCSSRV